MGCGCHPDIVARVWDEIGAALPQDSRGFVERRPALIHRGSGIIIALAMGTQYCLRLPRATIDEAVASGAKRATTWSDKTKMDVQSAFGNDWVSGAWLKQELGWTRQVYDEYSAA